MTVSFTPYREEFYIQSCMLMEQTWDLNDWLEDPEDETLIFKHYFESALNYSRYTDFIVSEDGRVMGYLMASDMKNKTLASTMGSGLKNMVTTLTFFKNGILGRMGERGPALAVAQLLCDLDRITYEGDTEYDSEITLFFVGTDLRGQGYGRKLMDRYLDYCKASAIKTIVLSTDLDCNYGFYDHYGFALHRKFHHPLLDKPEEEYNGFIYTLALD